MSRFVVGGSNLMGIGIHSEIISPTEERAAATSKSQWGGALCDPLRTSSVRNSEADSSVWRSVPIHLQNILHFVID